MRGFISVILVVAGLYWIAGALVCVVTAAGVLAIAGGAGALSPRKKRVFPRLPVEGWSVNKTRYDEQGIPYLED